MRARWAVRRPFAPPLKDSKKALSEKAKRRRRFLESTWRQHHHHLTALKFRILFDLCDRLDILLDPNEEFHAEVLMCHFTAAKAQRHFYFVAFIEESPHRAHLHVIIVNVDGGAHLDLFDLDDLLLFSRFCRFFLLFVFVFSIVHEFDYGRLGAGRYFDEIEAFLFSDGESVFYAKLAKLFTVCADKKNRICGDVLVDARPLLSGRRLLSKPSNSYDILPLKGSCTAAPRNIWVRDKFPRVIAQILSPWACA